MLFTSIIFFIFLSVTLFVYYLLPVKYRVYFLVAASIFFYMYAAIWFIFLGAFIVITNYFIGIKIEESSEDIKRKRYLVLGVLINLSVLIFFKYWNFLIINIAYLLGILHVHASLPYIEILLPLGLSYYIFQSIGYLFDLQRGHQKAERDFLRFSLFILFFPKLAVGPIERAGNFLPQVAKNIFFNKENIVEGSKRIAWGLFKKLVVADRISIYQAAVMSNQDQQSGITILFATVLYTFQVYADFSGYTDIALGVGRLFGYNLMENFRQPLLSKNLSDFWRRWHISLSSWVNDYIFTPIAFKRRAWGTGGVFYSLIISFVVIGIWHGPTWNYVLFGFLQALALMYEFSTRKLRKRLSMKIPPVIYNNTSILLTFLYISFSLIIFRTDTFSHASAIMKAIFIHTGTLFYDKPSTLLFILIGCIIMMIYDIIGEYKVFRTISFSNKNWVVQQIPYALLVVYILIAGVFDGGQFIYFAF